MESKKITIFQAYKFYTGGSIIFHTLRMILYSIVFPLIMVSVIDVSFVEIRYYVLMWSSTFSYLFVSSGVLNSFEPESKGKVFCSAVDCIEMYQKQHFAAFLSGIFVTIFSYLFFGIVFSCMTESITMGLIILVIGSLLNLLSAMKGYLYKIIILCGAGIPVIIFSLVLLSLASDKIIKFQFGATHIILAFLAAIIYLFSERYVLKYFETNWYKD